MDNFNVLLKVNILKIIIIIKLNKYHWKLEWSEPHIALAGIGWSCLAYHSRRGPCFERIIMTFASLSWSLQVTELQYLCHYLFKQLRNGNTTRQGCTIGYSPFFCWVQWKLDGVGPIDNRPSTNKLQYFVKKKKKNVTYDTWHVTCDM